MISRTLLVQEDNKDGANSFQAASRQAV